MSARRGLRTGGFTLVEVLVALMIMAIMAAMAWQGVDGIARARAGSEASVDRLLRLNSVLAQWEQDLGAIEETEVAPALSFDGATLRLTRRVDDGVELVAWSLRQGRWLRWVGPASTGTRSLQDSWLRSLQLLGTEPEQLRALEGVAQWQVYFYRGNGWSNAQSTGDVVPGPGAAPAVGRTALPSGVRVLLTFADGSGLSGQLLRDVRLGPQLQ